MTVPWVILLLWLPMLGSIAALGGYAPTPSSKMYWTDSSAHTIRRANLDGSDVEDVISCDPGSQPRGMVIDEIAGKVYWGERRTKRVKRANLDGTSIETIVMTYRGPEGLAIDRTEGKLYWTDVEGRVQRADIETGTVEGIIEAAFMSREGIAINTKTGHIFWPSVDLGFAGLQRANLDGSEEVELLNSDDGTHHSGPTMHDISGPRGIAVHGESGKIYWSDVVTDHICRASADGTDVEQVVSGGLHSPLGIAFDDSRGKMYWVDRGNSTLTSDFDTISRSNLDGTNREVLISDGLAEPRSIAILP